MKKISKVSGYEIFEVEKGDSNEIIETFHLSPVDYLNEDVHSALAALESGKKEDFLARYPYEGEISDWEADNLMHPLFVISTKNRNAKYKNILYITPPLEDMEDVFFTDDGKYWGDDRWEPLPWILLGLDPEDEDCDDPDIKEEAEETSDEILQEIFDSIHLHECN